MIQILSVDDDINTLNLIRAILEKNGFKVFSAENSVEALNYIDKEHIDLAIIDIMMPKVDGYELTSELRIINTELPIMMLSAKQLPDDRKKGFLVGIDDYMSKPIDEEEFILHIKALLRRSKIYSERKIIIGDVVIDYDSLTVTRKDEIINLPQKEFLLLYKLLSYPDKIFTRIQLMDEIWGLDCDTGWETITVHVNRLRKKFENYPEFEIVSIRGLGYKAIKRI